MVSNSDREDLSASLTWPRCARIYGGGVFRSGSTFAADESEVLLSGFAPRSRQNPTCPLMDRVEHTTLRTNLRITHPVHRDLSCNADLIRTASGIQ